MRLSEGVEWGLHCCVVLAVLPDGAALSTGRLAEFHEELWAQTGIPPARTVLGGFSMGSVMSYALGLAGERPVPGGILAFSGFIPTVEGWQPDLAGRRGMRVFIAHGRNDPVIDVEFARDCLRKVPEPLRNVDAVADFRQ